MRAKQILEHMIRREVKRQLNEEDENLYQDRLAQIYAHYGIKQLRDNLTFNTLWNTPKFREILNNARMQNAVIGITPDQETLIWYQGDVLGGGKYLSDVIWKGGKWKTNPMYHPNSPDKNRETYISPSRRAFVFKDTGDTVDNSKYDKYRN